MRCEVCIEALGAGGDGIAYHDGTRVFVAGALPGERVQVDLGRVAKDGYHARLLERFNDGAARTEPVCEYFAGDRGCGGSGGSGGCGGCVAQHIAALPYAAWKLTTLRDALAHRGLGDTPVAALISYPPASRRRARFAVSGNGMLGFRRRGASEIIAIAHCPVVLPALEALLTPLGQLAAEIGGGLNEISLTQAHHGLDVILHGLEAPPGMALREDLAAFAQTHGIARLSVEITGGGRRGAKSGGSKRGRHRKRRGARELETITQPGAVRAGFGAADVALPVGAFLQATAAGEAAINRLVLQGLDLEQESHAHIADLYAGIGAIGFSLISARAGQRVAMFEGVAAMAAAAEAAARTAGLAVSTEARDLARRPLSVAELKPFDAVIFDPPRAGARAQAETLAASGVARIAAVSCNPASFARDARILVNGGYRLTGLTPIDQFLWSNHVELVALFQRDSN